MTDQDQGDAVDASVDHPRVVRGDARFEIHVDDSGTPAGFAVIRDVQAKDGTKERIFPHTEVDDTYEGKGLASTLVREALDATIAEGARIVAVCPYVKKWIVRHPDYQEHTAAVRPDHLQALDR